MLQGFENSYIANFHGRGFGQTELYFVTVYFVLTTILTIGFGDITPLTTLEVMVTLVV